LILFILL